MSMSAQELFDLFGEVVPVASADLYEARRLVASGIKLVELQPLSKQPKGDKWNHNMLSRVEQVRAGAGGFGIPLAVNNLCSVDFDNVAVAEKGLRACGIDPEDLRMSGVSTSSTRPGSGGRVAFKVPAGSNLRWLRFTNAEDGTILELRAASANLQDCMPGTTYMTKEGGPFVQQYSGFFTFDTAPDLPPHVLAWWQRMSTDIEFLHQQQTVIAGAKAQLDVSSGNTLAFSSDCRVDFNNGHSVEDMLIEHGYSENRGRYAPPTASGTHGVRPIPGRDDLWQSDHASDPLFGTFDAWTVFVALAHGGNLVTAEGAARAGRALVAVEGFSDVEVQTTTPLSDGTPAGAPELPFFERDKRGKITAIINNLLAAIGSNAVTGVDIGHDTFRDALMVSAAGSGLWRSFKDADYVALRSKLETGRNGFAPIGRELCKDAVLAVADRNQFDSAQVWLDGIVWDGTKRIDTFLHALFSAEDTPYSRAVSAYMWTAMAGRVLSPGCKADMVPILVGAQGEGKSTAVSAMSPSMEFFAEVSFSESDDNLSRKMRGKLIAEFGELRGLHSKELESVKAFVTRTHEKWIPKYREFETTFPRRLIFVGTTNKDQFLADETGNRRWLPIRVGLVDVERIRNIADQCWAEAAVRFKATGVAWQQAQELAKLEHHEFSFSDDWAETVQQWLAKGALEVADVSQGLRVTDVLKWAIGMPPDKIRRGDEMRMGGVLRSLGYEKERVMIDGVRANRYCHTTGGITLLKREVCDTENPF